MGEGVKAVRAAIVACLVLLPAAAFAQEGQIAGTIRDSSGGVMPGVTVEVTSPALIEKVRSTVSEANGQYRITNLPVGVYSVTFTLEGFTVQRRDDVAPEERPISLIVGVRHQRHARRNQLGTRRLDVHERAGEIRAGPAEARRRGRAGP